MSVWLLRTKSAQHNVIYGIRDLPHHWTLLIWWMLKVLDTKLRHVVWSPRRAIPLEEWDIRRLERHRWRCPMCYVRIT